LIKPII
jgi:adenylate kinase family enzyme